MFVRLLSVRRGTWALILGYGFAMALTAYTHLTAILTVVAHAAVWLTLAWRHRKRDPAAIWPALAGLAWATVLTLTVYAVVLPQVFGSIQAVTTAKVATEWQNPLWLVSEALQGLARGFPGGWASLALGAVVAALGIISYWQRNRAVTALMLLPGVLTIAAALTLSYNLWPRYLFFLAGFASLIVIRGGFRLTELVVRQHATRWATVGVALVIVASAATVPRAWHPKQGFQEAVHFIERMHRPGDAVVLIDVIQYPFLNYLHQPWTPVDDVSTLRAIEHSAERTWLLYTFPIRLPVVYPAIWSRIQRYYRTATVIPGTVGGGNIFVMVTP